MLCHPSQGAQPGAVIRSITCMYDRVQVGLFSERSTVALIRLHPQRILQDGKIVRNLVQLSRTWNNEAVPIALAKLLCYTQNALDMLDIRIQFTKRSV